MTMDLKSICKILEEIAPPALAEDWDNVGLLAGDEEQKIKRIMLTIDMTREVLTEAKDKKIDLLLAYHPPIWDPIKQVVAGWGSSPLLYEAIRSNISIYALHTALDSVVGGINDVLAEIVGIEAPEPLQSIKVGKDQLCKLVVFVPVGELEKVSEAMFAAGAGELGNYSRCSFRGRGMGTFQGGAGSKPSIGKVGSFEQVEEYRLESIVPKRLLGEVIKAMLAAHPYEEVAYDVIELLTPEVDTGLGRMGKLRQATAIPDLITRIKKELKVKCVGIIGPKRGKVHKAAVGAGSCGSLLREVIANGCDFYLTGELKHNYGLELQEAGVTCCCVGHSNSERMILPRIARRLKKELPTVEVTVSRKDHDPCIWG